jgi:tetratricopeptide (TPR) repeat protein
MARQYDPLSPFMIRGHALILYYARRYDQALQVVEDGVALDPESHRWPNIRGLVYDQQGKPEEAIEQFEEAIARGGGVLHVTKAGLGYAYAVAGRTEDALLILDDLQQELTRRDTSPIYLAVIATGLGDKDKAFAWFEEAYDRHSRILFLIITDPWFDSLHSDPRYTDLITRMGLVNQ